MYLKSTLMIMLVLNLSCKEDDCVLNQMDEYGNCIDQGQKIQTDFKFPCQLGQLLDEQGNCVVVTNEISPSNNCNHPDEILCNGTCTNIKLDVNHCGACQISCSSGEFCYNGNCQINCDGKVCVENEQTICVDTTSNLNHCGDCSIKCAVFDHSNSTCQNSECKFQCEPSFGDCDGIFQNGCETNTNVDTENCGSCDRICPDEASCIEGNCTCPNQQIACGLSCVDINTDVLNCGGCNQACPQSATCQSGQCICPEGTFLCNNQCVDLTSDRENCGQCGNICEQTYCSSSRCTDIVDIVTTASYYSFGNFSTYLLFSDGNVVKLGDDSRRIAFSDSVSAIKACSQDSICALLSNGNVEKYYYTADRSEMIAYERKSKDFVGIRTEGYTIRCDLLYDQTIACYARLGKKIVLPHIRTNFIFTLRDKVCFQDFNQFNQNYCIDFGGEQDNIYYSQDMLRNDLNEIIQFSTSNYSNYESSRGTHCFINDNHILKCIDGNQTNYTSVSDLEFKDVDYHYNDTFLGLLTNHQLYVWGDNSSGQFGDGTTSSSQIPVAQGLNIEYKFIEKFANEPAFIGVTTDNRLLTWGSTDSRSVPEILTPVQAFKDDINAIIPTKKQVFEITEDGTYHNNFKGAIQLYQSQGDFDNYDSYYASNREMIYQLRSSGNGIVNVQVVFDEAVNSSHSFSASLCTKSTSDDLYEYTCVDYETNNQSVLFSPIRFEAGRIYTLKIEAPFSLFNDYSYSLSVQGLVAPECFDDQNCDPMQKCLGGVCRPKNNCFTNSDCIENETCENNICTPLPIADDLCDVGCGDLSMRLGIEGNEFNICNKTTVSTIRNTNTSINLTRQQKVLLILNQNSKVVISSTGNQGLANSPPLSAKCQNKTAINKYQFDTSYNLEAGSYYFSPSINEQNLYTFTITPLVSNSSR